ncbi:MAG: hypothetical protein ACJAT4_000286 [Granulosicoccus sp.]|jgi:hypothetical protein
MSKLILILSVFSFGYATLHGQVEVKTSDVGAGYPEVDERKIIETKWRYTYALHLESNTIFHKAEKDYEYFLHFKYDYTYDQFLNGKFDKGVWSLNGSDLFYSFKHIKKFEIAQITKNVLVLEFEQPNSKGTYQYHFVRVDTKDAPFIKPVNELPDILVEELDPKKNRNQWWAFGKNKKKKKRKWRRRKRDEPKEKEIYISIELIGGGYYGGIDPVLRDYIHIKSSGRLIKEFKSVNKGLMVTKKTISRDELEAFAEFIITQKFFEIERMYDCEDALCQKRKANKPTPIPLRLAVAYGSRKRVITISIWGKDKNNMRYVDYPDSIDNIVEAIQKMALRLEES